MKEDTDNLTKLNFREWLEKLQQESWQLELIISGFALFGIWEAKSLVGLLSNYSTIHVAPGVFKATLRALTLGVQVSWMIFFINLLIHVFTRGLWIGAIGLRYVSGDIDFKALDYSSPFTNFLSRRIKSFDEYIERLERFASVLFAYTFLLFFMWISFLALIFWTMAFAFLFIDIFNNPALLGLVVILFFLVGLVVFIDFISMGALKRIKEKGVANVYFIIYRFYSFATLSFLYRPLLYNFLDEKFTRRLFFFSIPYVLVISLLPGFKSDATPFFPIESHTYLHDFEASSALTIRSRYYDDERAQVESAESSFFGTKTPIRDISLKSSKVTGSFGEIFLRTFTRDGKFLKDIKNITPFNREGIIHTMFGPGFNQTKDSLQVQLQEANQKAIKTFVNKRLELERALRNKESLSLQPGLIIDDGNLKIDRSYWQNLRDSINTYWKNSQDNAKKEKTNSIIAGILELNQVYIDGIPYSDSLTCHYYLHPNMGEKGLRCYFPTKHLEEGPHQITLKRDYFNKDEDTELSERVHEIPFFFIRD